MDAAHYWTPGALDGLWDTSYLQLTLILERHELLLFRALFMLAQTVYM